MTGLTLPGGPGWIRECSPCDLVIIGPAPPDVRVMVSHLSEDPRFEGQWVVYSRQTRGPVPVPTHGLALRLGHRTGRAHAAWWVVAALTRHSRDLVEGGASHMWGGASGPEVRALRAAMRGDTMTDVQIATLHALCLRLAGLS